MKKKKLKIWLSAKPKIIVFLTSTKHIQHVVHNARKTELRTNFNSDFNECFV